MLHRTIGEKAMIHLKIVLTIFITLSAIFLATGWRTVSDATRDEQVRQQLKQSDMDAFRLEQRVDDIDKRLRALEARP